MNDFDDFLRNLTNNSSTIAFVSDESRFTYQDLIVEVGEAVNLLKTNNVATGTLVAVIGDFSYKTIALVFALFINRNIVIPISTVSNIALGEVLKISGADHIIDATDMKPSFATAKFTNIHTDVFYTELRELRSPGLVLFSSGTSGKPKGIVHNVDRVISKFKKAGKRYISVPLLMFDHFGGYNTVFGLLASGSEIVYLRERSVDSVAKAVERFKVTLLPTTPSFLALLLAARVDRKYNLESLEKISYGTEVMPPNLLEKLHNRFPKVKFQQTYGLSELGVLSTQSRADDSTWLKIGGVGYETKVVANQLWIKSQYSMLGYISQESFIQADGWFNTQDRVEIDGDYYRILGRDSDLINIGGQKAFPQEIEDVLLGLEYVTSVRVTGETHNLLGQIVKAEIVLADNAKVSKGDIRAYCKEHLTNYKVPQKIEFVAEIPLTHRMKKGK